MTSNLAKAAAFYASTMNPGVLPAYAAYKGYQGLKRAFGSSAPAKTVTTTYTPVKRARYVSSNSRGLNRRGVSSQETGFVDLAAATYAFDTTGSIVLLATIAQGASVNQRVGKKVVLKSIQGRGQAVNGTTAANNDVAFLIVYDRRPTGALPAITDILNTATSKSFNNDANSGRFTILKRWDGMLLGPITGVIATEQLTDCSAVSTDFYLDLKKRPLNFKAAGTGAIGDIEEGALYLVTVGINAAGTAAASLDMGFRTRFIDV